MGVAGDIELLVIADDLTGSNDAGAQFAKRGISSIVLTNPGIVELPRGQSVVVVNTESRHLAASEAAGRVAHIAQIGLAAGVRHLFKKTDSTLRGNIGAELKALIDVTGEDWIPFVPAFPEMGRTTQGGIHCVDGVRISETAFAMDPLSPVRESEVAKVLSATATMRVLSLEPGNIPERPEADCVVVDCTTREELTAIAHELKTRGKVRVLAGSAAFAEELPGILVLPQIECARIKPRGPILFVNGSLNPRALEQVAAGQDLFRKVKITPEQLFDGRPPSQLVDEPGDVMLCSVERRGEVEEYGAKARQLGISPGELHHAAAERHGQIVKGLLETGPFGTVVVFGGDTLMGIARAMGWNAFVPEGEVEAGVTVSTPFGVPAGELVVVSKAGGFGDREVLPRIVGWVKH